MMTTMKEHKQAIADRQCFGNCDMVKCINCTKWGYNRGKDMDSMGRSKCMRDRKTGKTDACQWCLKFDSKW